MTYQLPRAHDGSFLDVEEANTPMHVGGAFLFSGGPLMQPDGGIVAIDESFQSWRAAA